MTFLPSASAPASRFLRIDFARGAALCAMFIYHFIWDLRYFNLLRQDIPGWGMFSHAIASAFLFLAGFSLVLAQNRGAGLRQQLRHLLMIALAAGAISLATYIMFPQAFIFCGILHCILLASLIALPLLRAPIPAVAMLAALALAAPRLFASELFDGPWLWWTGLNIGQPSTLDYRPILPWLGVVLAGTLAARMALARDARLAALQLVSPNRLTGLLALAGRNSLAVYLVHQPVFLAVLYLAAAVIAPPAPDEGAAFGRVCQSQCEKAKGEPQVCARACACVAGGLKDAGLWRDALANKLDDHGHIQFTEIVSQCRQK